LDIGTSDSSLLTEVNKKGKTMKKIVMYWIMACCLTAQAGVIYFNYTANPVEQVISRHEISAYAFYSYIEFTLDGAVTNNSHAGNNSVMALSAQVGNFMGSFYAAEAYTPLVLNLNDPVNASLDWSDGSRVVKAEVLGSGSDLDVLNDFYFGIRLDAGDGNYYYGWARGYAEANVDSARNPASISTAGVYEMAINNTINQGLAVGAIPEPATALILVIGGGLIGFYRRFFGRV